MAKFKVGDRVTVVEGRVPSEVKRWTGRTGTVVDVLGIMHSVELDSVPDGHKFLPGGYLFADTQLELWVPKLRSPEQIERFLNG